jgi:hypothetical protein
MQVLQIACRQLQPSVVSIILAPLCILQLMTCCQTAGLTTYDVNFVPEEGFFRGTAVPHPEDFFLGAAGDDCDATCAHTPIKGSVRTRVCDPRVRTNSVG